MDAHRDAEPSSAASGRAPVDRPRPFPRCRPGDHLGDDEDADDWERDQVTTRGGIVIPVRATARRPTWPQLPTAVQHLVETSAKTAVVASFSAGTGFTAGFASRLDLADGRRIFVKAASSADDRVNGWSISGAYRDEVRNRLALPDGIGAPRLIWYHDVALAGEQWLIMAFEHVDGAPPRRPWRDHELRLVLNQLTKVAEPLQVAPEGLQLETLWSELGGIDKRLVSVRRRQGDSPWLSAIERLCHEAELLTTGSSIVHMDLRDDNMLIGPSGAVWFVDWNWPVLGARWVDTICLLLSAHGDGYDTSEIVTRHPLTRDVDPHAIDALLAVLWSYWAVTRHHEVPTNSPHVRDHQAWYLEVTSHWLSQRLGVRP